MNPIENTIDAIGELIGKSDTPRPTVDVAQEEIQQEAPQELANVPVPRPSPERTGSTKRPVPPANVGEKRKASSKGEPKTILDVILGSD